MSEMTTRTVELTIYENKANGRLLALCDEVKGFAAQAADMTELKARIPRLMKALLEADGASGVEVAYVEDIEPGSDSVTITAGSGSFRSGVVTPKAEIRMPVAA